jgi:uncharacterized protein YfdQ (DUF2303 family)
MDFQPLIDALRVRSTKDTIALPPGTKLVPTELQQELPCYMRGEIRVESLDSLYQYVRRYTSEDAGHPVIFAQREQSIKITACLDWEAWGEHRAVYELGYTPEWIAWQRISGQKIGQVAFAEFIEENLDCIHAPAAADVLTVATTLSGKRRVEFTNCVTLQNGDRSLQWNETTDAKAAGDIRVPSEITLRIPIFKGSEAATTFEIKALFRYRIHEGQLTYEIKLLNADKVCALAFDQIVTAMRNEFAADDNEPLIVVGQILSGPRPLATSNIIKN